jgi:hypothetical protein
MPDGGSALVDWCGCEGFTVEDQLSHVLPRYVEQLGHIRQAVRMSGTMTFHRATKWPPVRVGSR